MGDSRKAPIIGVAADPQSYINIVYLILGLPLGIAYFVFLVTGISVGLGLVVIWVGVPMLALVLLGSWAMCQLERVLAISLLKEDIPFVAREDRAKQHQVVGTDLSAVEKLFVGAWRRLKAHLSNRLTWTGIFYLFLKFPLGIASFTIAVTLISFTGALLGAPAYYWVDEGIELGIWQVDVLWEAIVLTLIGVPAVFISLHLMNGTAFLLGRLARVMLGKMH